MKEIIKIIKNFAVKNNIKVYMVGGYIRDKLMDSNNVPKDIDIICDGCLDDLITYLKDRKYKVIFIKNETQMYRIIDNTISIDLVYLKNNDIIYDLSQRDFTLNAIALDLIDNIIIDPFDARKHIDSKILHEVSKESLKDDRIRILRGIRLLIKYDMHFSKETEINIRNQSKYIYQCAKERISNEILNIISCDREGIAFDIMDRYGVLNKIMPFIDELKLIGKCKYHKVNAFIHMNMVYKVYKEVITSKIKLEPIYKNEEYNSNNKLGQHYIKDYIALAAFAHDIGKFSCYERKGNNISFKNHEKIGADIIQNWCKLLKFPKKGTEIITDIIRGHMYPLWLFKNKNKNYKINNYKFFLEYNENIPYILLISFCDIYATDIYLNDKNEINNYRNFITMLFKEYSSYKIIKQNKIINGTEIINITGITGHYVGEILNKIDMNRYIGKIHDKEDAINFIKKSIPQ